MAQEEEEEEEEKEEEEEEMGRSGDVGHPTPRRPTGRSA